MKYFLILISAIFLSGCGASALLQKIPEAEFSKFVYHRGGNVTSADIEAMNARLTDTAIEIERVKVSEDWGPAFNFILYIEGYKRQRAVK